MLVFLIDFLNYELRERVDVAEDAFDESEFVLVFFFFLILVFMIFFEASYFLQVNFVSLVSNHFKVFKDFIEVAFHRFSI